MLARLSFRTKLLASHVGLVALVVGITIMVLNRSLGADLEAQLDQRLEQQVRGAAAWVGEGRRHPDKLAARIALIVHATTTIFDKDGRVLGNSSDAPEPDEPAPEVRAAQRGDVGRASRVVAGGDEMHYVAVAAGDGIILRLGAPLSGINATIREMRRQLFIAGGIALALALALGFLAARVASDPLRAMTASATRLARGDFDIAPPSASPDEFGLLSRTLAALAAELKAKIGDLTAERDRLSAILAGMAEGVLVSDGDGRVILANPAAAEILGKIPAPGAPLADAIPLGEVLAFVQAASTTGEVREGEIETDASGGRAIAIYARPLAARGSRGLVTVLRDMTRIRRLLSLRRDFVANVSHELRTPVTAIQGYAETLLRGTADETTARQFLEVIHRQSQRIGQLVGGLLRLSELEAAPDEARVREPIELRAIAEAALDTMRARAAETGARLSIDVPADLVAMGDPSGVEQIVLNLVDNALKYGRPGGAVTIGGSRSGREAILEIADDGPGIEARHLPRLFERFYRVDAGRSRDRGGSGLGLAIVKHLVESMGGRIDVESTLGKGTRFTVRLPAKTSQGAAEIL